MIFFFFLSLNREAKKGNSKKDTVKKSSKPKRWESFKGAFAIKQRSQSPAPPSNQERKKVAKKSFMDRVKVKRGGGSGSNQLSLESEENRRPLSFMGTEEKSKDTLDVFGQYEVSKSLPSSPVAKKKKHSLRSRESPPPISPMSMSSGSPFGGATTEDSQTSTPSHIVAAMGHDHSEASMQQQKEGAPTVVGQEIQIRADVEDTPPTAPIPTIVEPSVTAETSETVETGEMATTATDTQSKPVSEPVQPEIVVEQEQESATESPVKQVKPAESIETTQKDVESTNDEPVEQAASVAQESLTGSPSEDAGVVIKTEAEKEDKSSDKTAEPVTDILKQSESPSEQNEAAIIVEKEPALPVTIVTESVESKNEKPALPTKPAVVTEGKPALPVKPAVVKEKDSAEKKSEKPTLPVKPTLNETTERKSAKPVLPAKPATVPEKEPVPAKDDIIIIVEKEMAEKVEEPTVPKYLKDRTFLWDTIREVLETAPESTENASYSELPPQEATWMENSSPVEQLRAFLMVCP